MSAIVLEHLGVDGRTSGTSDGRRVRVAGGLPGERVLLEPGSGREPVLGEILEPSPHRRTPPCPHSARCGGCDLDHAEPDARRAWLGEAVRHTLRWEAPVEVVPSPRPVAHRARITLHLEEGRLGYRAPRSHELVEIDVCRIARPEIQEAHRRLVDLIRRAPDAIDGLSDVEIRTDGERTVFVFDPKGDRRTTRPHPGLAELGDVVVAGRTLAGSGDLAFEVAGVRLRAGPRAFFQVNLEANALLGEHVRSELLARSPERVLDLYAGIGNLSLPLAARKIPVVAVEAPGPGSEDLRRNSAGLPVEVHARPVERFDATRTPFDALILDPPRAGAPGVLPRVTLTRPRVIVLVSCFATSTARDLAELRGYRTASVRCFDLFPDTHHVETVVVLERG